MPELPEMEITARRLGPALEGQVVESALAPGINALKTFDPPLHALEGRAVTGVRRRGKLLLVDFMIHERTDYAIQLGHVWQGFDDAQIVDWLDGAGFTGARCRPLPADPAAKGPSLFAATARKKTRK